MPYSGTSDKSLPSNVKKMPAKKKKAWVATFNNVYKTCIDDGGSATACETKAFKIANGNAKKQEIEQMATRSIFHRVWDGFLDSVGIVEETDLYTLLETPTVRSVLKARSTSVGRVYEQLRQALWDRADQENGVWAYPIDVYVDDTGANLFAIVAQSGKLYQVPLTISKDTVTLGDWTQVKEEFSPVEQSFRVRRQQDGHYRWLCIAGTTVLNRVGEIDSSELFDSFVERANKTGEYPRLDFYHYGQENPEQWEFGTADFLAREGTCYIASGTFDEDHPLAKATIQACEKEPGIWGNSIEFYAMSEPEIVLADPEVRIPVYKDGKNTRISVVLEEDAAGLFTRIGVKNEGVIRAMDAKTKEKLTKLFGDDTAGLETFISQFEENVDNVNRTVKDDKLIHRAKKETGQAATETETDDEKDEDTDEDTETEGSEDTEIVIDDETVAAIAQQVTQTAEFKTLVAGISDIKKLVGEMVVGREKDAKQIERLNKDVQRLSQDENEKKTEYLQDLPRGKRTHISHRPRAVHAESDQEEGMDAIASRTLNAIPASARY